MCLSFRNKSFGFEIFRRRQIMPWSNTRHIRLISNLSHNTVRLYFKKNPIFRTFVVSRTNSASSRRGQSAQSTRSRHQANPEPPSIGFRPEVVQPQSEEDTIRMHQAREDLALGEWDSDRDLVYMRILSADEFLGVIIKLYTGG